MADISMCHGTNCPKRDECWRHVAPRSKHWQSFFVTPPLKSVEPFECKHYWPAVDPDRITHIPGKESDDGEMH